MPRTEHHTTSSLDSHVGFIKRQVDRSMRDGETRQLAVKIVSNAYEWVTNPKTGDPVPVVEAWGMNFIAPDGSPIMARNERGEVNKIWDFMVLNVRYVYDPTDIDTFATLKHTLESGGGDCDDTTIAFAALLGSLGFRVIARVVSTNDNPDEWVHIYPMVGLPKDGPTKWLALDMTVAGVRPGWEYPDIARKRDFELV